MSAALVERLDAASFPHPVERLERIETAVSWVLLTGPYAYKIKKPVRFEFIDASSLERRRFLCDEELRLNRRFAPELYLDVLPIVERQGALRIGAEGTPLEYCVRMRQFGRSHELASELAAGRVSGTDVSDFGRQLAQWHAHAHADTASFGSAALVRAQIEENFLQLRGTVQDRERLARIADWAHARLASLAALIEQRRLGGRVRECHGDLHAGNIVRWQGRLLAFDCLEFEPQLRWIDVAGDVAFLFMDLTARGHRPLAFQFASAYLEESGDYQSLRLLDLFSVYRALVRAKVDALALGTAGADQARALRERLDARLAVAERLTRQRGAAVLLMRGVTGSGKSWLSGQLIGALGAARVRSDLERQRILGRGNYTAEATRRTYARLLECAADALAGDQRIIVDATFLSRAQRLPFLELAAQAHCPLLIIDCRAPQSVLLERVAQRAARGRDPSEATAEVLQRQLEQFEPLTGEEARLRVAVDTSAAQPLATALGALRARLPDADPG